jgi:hypothetical protein
MKDGVLFSAELLLWSANGCSMQERKQTHFVAVHEPVFRMYMFIFPIACSQDPNSVHRALCKIH